MSKKSMKEEMKSLDNIKEKEKNYYKKGLPLINDWAIEMQDLLRPTVRAMPARREGYNINIQQNQGTMQQQLFNQQAEQLQYQNDTVTVQLTTDGVGVANAGNAYNMPIYQYFYNANPGAMTTVTLGDEGDDNG